MSVVMATPGPAEIGRVATVLAGWQHDGGPLHLHPGDLGWYSRRGAEATSAATRTWSRDGTVLALGLLDGPQLLRTAFAPHARDDDELARQVLTDLDDPGRGVLDAGSATVECRGARRLTLLLTEHGWQPDEPWTPLHRDLTDPVEDPGTTGLRVGTVTADEADAWVAVHWSAFRGTPFPPEDRRRLVDGWRTMAAGPLYGGARSLAARDADGTLVAVATVWSAGPGRPGLLEPLGVHRDHRGRGHGTALTRAAAAALREDGASSAVVCAESANAGAVATYVAAGFAAAPQVTDLRRP